MFTPELFSMIGGAATGFLFRAWTQGMENRKQMFEMLMKRDAAQNNFYNDAAKRTDDKIGKYTRRIIVLFVMIMFLALIFVPMLNINTIVETAPQTKGIFWGLIEWTSKAKYIPVDGYLFPNELRQALLAIIGFYMGQGSAKP